MQLFIAVLVSIALGWGLMFGVPHLAYWGNREFRRLRLKQWAYTRWCHLLASLNRLRYSLGRFWVAQAGFAVLTADRNTDQRDMTLKSYPLAVDIAFHGGMATALWEMSLRAAQRSATAMPRQANGPGACRGRPAVRYWRAWAVKMNLQSSEQSGPSR